MSVDLQQYLIHPVERPLDDAEAKVDLIRSKDHPIMAFFYESCFIRHDYVLCDTEYALPYDELFCFCSTTLDDEKLGATVTMEIAGQTLTTDRNCFVQVPAFVPHGRISVTNMETPIFHYVTGTGREHTSLPKELWHPEMAPALEELVIYHSEESCNRDPHKCEHQRLVMRNTPGVTSDFKLGGSFRRFLKTPGWTYVKNAHIHATPEILGFYSADPWHPFDLGGTYSQSINGENVILDKPTVIYLPPYMAHCPIVVHKLEKDNFWSSTGLATGPESSAPIYNLKDYGLEENGEPMVWHMEEPW